MGMNGLIRAYLAREMKTENFLDYVLEGVEHKLKTCSAQTEVVRIWDQDRQNCMVAFRIGERIFSIRISRTMIEVFRKQEVYALDHLFREKLKEEGIDLQPSRHAEEVFV